MKELVVGKETNKAAEECVGVRVDASAEQKSVWSRQGTPPFGFAKWAYDRSSPSRLGTNP